MTLTTDAGSVDLNSYRVHSRREIIALLRSLKDRNQLVSLLISGGSDAVVTSILEVDEASNLVVVDRAPTNSLNQRILASNKISFETVLDQIRILFGTDAIQECLFEDQPALCFTIPASLIRLQRREFYRVSTPVASPVRCVIQAPDENGLNTATVTATLHNISAGGVSIVDEKKLLDPTAGRVYQNCRIDLPGGSPVTVTLQVRNCQELTLTSGKSIRRLGCMFVDLPMSQLAAVQRYITKLERERNARATGMR